jgi:hypothetical protein
MVSLPDRLEGVGLPDFVELGTILNNIVFPLPALRPEGFEKAI